MTIADLRVGLRAYLLDDAAISAAVGGARIYPIQLPQGQKLASIVYARIYGQGDHHMVGPSGLNRVRVQVDCWAMTADVADLLARQVKERLDGYRGAMLWGDESPADAIVVQGIFYDSEREDWDDAAQMYRSSKDYIVWFAER